MTVEQEWAGKGTARERVKATIMSMTKVDPVVKIMVRGRGKRGGRRRMPMKVNPRLKSPAEAFKSDEVM